MPLSSHDLKPFVRRVFVETGSGGLGLGIRSALSAGFEEVYSIDINPAAYAECSDIFKDDKRVHLFCGDCSAWLEETLSSLNEECTVYLDANGWQEDRHPLYGSLDAICRHGNKNHTIIIDDMNSDHFSREQCEKYILREKNNIVEYVRRVNPNYVFSLLDSHSEDLSQTYVCWILVAEPYDR